MARWAALIRGINVGGGNKVPMAELRAACEGAGLANVRSYIASGNLVFDAKGTADDISATLQDVLTNSFGVATPILVLSEAALRARLATRPLDPEKGSHLHGMFTFADYEIDEKLRDLLISPSETLYPAKGIVWLHAPEGIGRSKLAAKLEQVIGKTTLTTRNLNTICALADMLDDAP